MMPDVYGCPAEVDSMPGATAYLAITGAGSAFPFDRTMSAADVRDGLAATAMVGEIEGSAIIWSKPDDLVLGNQVRGQGGFGSTHTNGWNMLFGDGSVRYVSESTSSERLHEMMTIAGGEAARD
jgi:prepilin-type processing-associated H-X9-DG protein